MIHKLNKNAEQGRHLPLKVLRLLRILLGSVKQHFREIEKDCGVSASHLWVLMEIQQRPDIGVTELSERLSIHQSTCSQLVEKLEGKGLVRKVRKQSDQRRVGLEILPEGLGILAKAPDPEEGILPEALSALPAETLESLHASLTEVIRNLHSRSERFAGRPLADI